LPKVWVVAVREAVRRLPMGTAEWRRGPSGGRIVDSSTLRTLGLGIGASGPVGETTV
jgi:hypothetical protein